MQLNRISIFALFFISLNFSLSGQNLDTKNILWTADDYVMAEQAASFEISPDGKWVLWLKSIPSKEKDRLVSYLFISSLTNIGETQLTQDIGGISSPKWSPDGKHISFIANSKAGSSTGEASEQLWLINPFGGEPWKVSSFQRETTNYFWANADSIVFSAKEDYSNYEKAQTNDDTVVVEDEKHVSPIRLFRYDISRKETKRLTLNKDQIEDFTLSPNGDYAITIHQQSLSYEYDNKAKPLIYLYNLKTGEGRHIFSDVEFNPRAVRWSPDSNSFYLLNNYKPDPTYLWGINVQVWFYPMNTGSPVKVDLKWANGVSGGFAATSDGFVALLANGARNKLARYVRKDNEWSQEFITGEHSENIFGFTLGKDEKTFIYNYSTASKPTEWYRSTLTRNSINSPLQITNIGHRFRGKTISRTELINWKGARNEKVEGLLYYPHNYQPGNKYPLVVMIHGGPALVDYDTWRETPNYPHNLYNQKGAFVLAPNYHGSSNYGLAWAESIGKGNYYDLEVPDIEKGVDHLIGQGMVDPDKLGVLGWSNGSLLTIALTTSTTRYKAAGAGAGVVDWTSDWGTAYFGASFNNYYLGASPLEDPQRYLEKSPFYKLDRVRTPTIIFFGEKDATVAPTQGWLHFRALQQLGKTDVRFVIFPGEGHIPRKLTHQKRKIEEEISWFDKYLFKIVNKSNEALRENSPLSAALKLKKARREKELYGLLFNKTLIPETVEYDGLNIGRFEVTRAQYHAFDKEYLFETATGNYPANGISYERARDYLKWLSQISGMNYRLFTEDEAGKIYANAGKTENTLDYWAGYNVNPEDAARLEPAIKELGHGSILLREVGSFGGVGASELVFDLVEMLLNGRPPPGKKAGSCLVEVRTLRRIENSSSLIRRQRTPDFELLERTKYLRSRQHYLIQLCTTLESRHFDLA